MKKIGIMFLVMSLAMATYSQDAQPEPVQPKDPFRVAKSQKTAGWILSGLGAAGLLGTLVADAGQDAGGAFVTLLSLGTVQPERKSFTVPYVVSAVALAGGITLLSASSRTKRRMKDVSHFFSAEQTELVQRSGVHRRVLPVAGIRVDF